MSKRKNFDVGDIAIALSTATPPNQPRTKGNAYNVTRLRYCPNNGVPLININNTESTSKTLHCACGQKHASNGLAWTLTEKFIHPDDIPGAMEEAVAVEDYELAADLRDIKIESDA